MVTAVPCPPVSPASGKPVRYSNGEVQIEVDDVSAGGYGADWGHTRTYSNQIDYDYDFGNGYNWLVRQWSYLVPQGPNAPYGGTGPMVPSVVLVVRGTRSALWFDLVNGQYVARYGAFDTLTYDQTNSQFVLTSQLGNVTTFQDFIQTANPQGLFKSATAAGGQTTAVTAYSGQNIQSIERSVLLSGVTTTDSFQYTYSGPNIQSILWQRQVGAGTWAAIRQVTYSYYGAGSPNGSAGDLQTATVQVPDGSGGLSDQQVYYYRYWPIGSSSSSSSGGPAVARLIKFVVNPGSFTRMQNAGLNPVAASDSQVAVYADYYFEYDGSARVTKEVTQGGLYTYKFAYTAAPSWPVGSSSSSSSSSGFVPASGYNTWMMKTVETRPDASTVTIYTNVLGQVLLRGLFSGTQSWIEVQQFDENANLVLAANPSAVASYNDRDPQLGIGFKSTSGLIRLYTYYPAGSSSSSSSLSGNSAPAGYLEAEYVQNGTTNTPIMLRQYAYGLQSAGGAAIYPISSVIEYRNDDGTGAVTTGYAYAYYSGTVAVQQRTTTYPVVSAAQNGSGIAATRLEYLDAWGNLTWEMGPRGFIIYQNFDSVTGGLLQRIDDFNTSLGGQPAPPAGWTTPAGGGLNLITDYTVDSLGRTTQELAPSHTISLNGVATSVRTATWTVYQDSTASGAASEVWSAQGYATGRAGSYTYTLVNPVSITRYDDDGQLTDQISAIRSSTSGPLLPSDSFPQSSYCRWTNLVYNSVGQLVATNVYFNIAAASYNQTTAAYDGMGRQNRSVNGGGTITRTVFDARDLALSVWVGTNDNGATDNDPTGGGAPGNNMVTVQTNQYDGGAAGGDGNLTQQLLFVDRTDQRASTFQYDWRNRQVQITAAQDWYLVNTFDTMNRLTQADQHAQSTGNLIGRNQTLFDDRGQVYQTVYYAVDPNTGNVGNSLTSNTWFDPAGNVLMNISAGATGFTKSVYDGIGRETVRYVGQCLGTIDYNEATSVGDDTIAEQVEMLYDEASNVIQTTTRMRFHNASGAGGLTYPGGPQPQARVTYVALYSDGVGRPRATADFGTNGDVTLTRPDTVPTSSTTVLVTQTLYNSRGEPYQSVDPAGRIDQTTLDDAGRRTELVKNVQSASSSSSSSNSSGLPASDDKNRATFWTWTADDLIATLSVVNAQTGSQTTTYQHGSTLRNSYVARNDVLVGIVYADGSSVAYSVNAQSEVMTFTDQNGTAHLYSRDLLGRITLDNVALGLGVDNLVTQIARTYEVRGMPLKITSLNAQGVQNEVEFAYNSFRQVITEYQEHNGAVNTSSSLNVQYAYADGSAGTVRRTKITYPSGYAVSYAYNDGLDDALNRISSIDGASYVRIGAETIVELTYGGTGVTWSLINGSGADPYAGLDQFNRVVDSRWFQGTTDLDRVQHGYDLAGNRLYRRNTVGEAMGANVDELYAYDGLYRLADFQRGQLSSDGKSIVSGTETFSQAWGLDSTGNWSQFDEADGGTLTQTRTANTVNEITGLSGGGWVLPRYDAAGNMTTMPLPQVSGFSYQAQYDGWGRLRIISTAEGGPNIVTKNYYDGLGRRIWHWRGTDQSTSDAYYSDRWQVLEERQYGTQPLTNVWGARHIDDLVVSGPIGMYAMQDPNWNVSAICNASGLVTERYTYAGYGQPTFRDAGFHVISSSAYMDTLFAGYRWDSESGLYCVRHRYLNPMLGVWATRDGLDTATDTNLYLYAHASPPTYIDPLGLLDCKVDCGGTNIGTLTASPVFYHTDRQTPPSTSRSGATGIGFSIDFKPNASGAIGAGPCCCAGYKFIQVRAVSTEGISVDVPNVSKTPFYGTFRPPHTRPPGQPEAGTQVNAYTLYDRPFYNVQPPDVNEFYRAAFYACIVCIGKQGKKDKILNCVSYVYFRYVGADGNWLDAQAKNSPRCYTAMQRWKDALTNDPRFRYREGIEFE